MKPDFTIDHYPHGWLICSPPGENGIPLNALSKISGRGIPAKAEIDLGIGHHYHVTLGRKVCMAVGMPEDLKLWRAAIEKEIAGLPLEERWWRGLDVGSSSAAIFAVFCADGLKWRAKEHGHASTPRDAGDFGRCKRLLDLFPAWRPRLAEVAAAYPDTKWPELVGKWDLLEAATPEELQTLLQ